MPVTVYDSCLGVVALRDSSLVSFVPFEGSKEERAKKLIQIQEGYPPAEFDIMLEQLESEGEREIELAKENLIETLRMRHGSLYFSKHEPRKYDVEKILVSAGYFAGVKEYREELREVLQEYTLQLLKRFTARRDLQLVHAIKSFDDLERSVNVNYSRLREWYGVHFPELAGLVDEPETYVNIVLKVAPRENMKLEDLVEMLGDKVLAEKMLEASGKSVGVSLQKEDYDAMRKLAEETINLMRLKRQTENYIVSIMSSEAPNLMAITGPLLGARIIALAGGLDKLARMPASTIQVLGAEKALFRFFKTGRGAPKHGVIFQHIYIHSAPRWQRGKIARVLASKIALAARIDHFSKEERAAELRRMLEDRIDEVRKKYPSPPKREEKKIKQGAGTRGRAR